MSTTFQVGASRRPHYQQADESLKPENLRVGGQVLAGTAKQDPFPNVVIEVAYKNQTFDKLLEKLHNWVHPRYTSVQVGIGIHISPNSNRRRAILLVRGQPVQETVTEFGDNIAITPLTLEFPMACIFEGVVWPNALLGHENDMTSIDLIALRQFIHNCIARTSVEEAKAARDAAQEATGIRVYGGVWPSGVDGESKDELNMGAYNLDNAMQNWIRGWVAFVDASKK
ncbi:hypothetical protein AC1031_014665 [Aphanomyces cochlioides]|nr:hypothetical protein AC1031_014665 [Aphanomyces cochlioides]